MEEYEEEEEEEEEEAAGTVARRKFPARGRPLGVQRRRQKKRGQLACVQQYMPERTPSGRIAENHLGNSQRGFGLVLGSRLGAGSGWLMEKPRGDVIINYHSQPLFPASCGYLTPPPPRSAGKHIF